MTKVCDFVGLQNGAHAKVFADGISPQKFMIDFINVSAILPEVFLVKVIYRGNPTSERSKRAILKAKIIFGHKGRRSKNYSRS